MENTILDFSFLNEHIENYTFKIDIGYGFKLFGREYKIKQSKMIEFSSLIITVIIKQGNQEKILNFIDLDDFKSMMFQHFYRLKTAKVNLTKEESIELNNAFNSISDYYKTNINKRA